MLDDMLGDMLGEMMMDDMLGDMMMMDNMLGEMMTDGDMLDETMMGDMAAEMMRYELMLGETMTGDIMAEVMMADFMLGSLGMLAKMAVQGKMVPDELVLDETMMDVMMDETVMTRDLMTAGMIMDDAVSGDSARSILAHTRKSKDGQGTARTDEVGEVGKDAVETAAGANAAAAAAAAVTLEPPTLHPSSSPSPLLPRRARRLSRRAGGSRCDLHTATCEEKQRRRAERDGGAQGKELNARETRDWTRHLWLKTNPPTRRPSHTGRHRPRLGRGPRQSYRPRGPMPDARLR